MALSAETPASYESLRHSLNKTLADNPIKGKYSITVRTAETGEAVFEKNPDTGITPASSLKIVTSAAALSTLGENFRFTTKLYTDGTVAGGILNGHLYLCGQGDPTLLKSDFEKFAADLKEMGIEKISGHLIGDDSWFDAERLSPGIAKEDECYYYAARISALNLSPNSDFDTGSVMVTASPARPGEPAAISVTPSTRHIRVVNRSKTVPKGYGNTLKITRKHRTGKIIITGNVPLDGADVKEWISVPDPTAYAVDVFRQALSEQGILFDSVSRVTSGKTPENAQLLFSKESMPLKELLVPFMKLSNNSHAEVLVKQMGKAASGEGSWKAGLAVMKNYLSSAGLDMSQWNFEDASGMSHANKITSSQLTQLLCHLQSEPWYESFLSSLPVSGAEDRFVGGTLRQRLDKGFSKGNIQAKTGTLHNVCSLSGYANTESGNRLIFTILTQDSKTDLVPVIDLLAEAIAHS